MDFLAVIILSIIEGITEFLPISSTGHMILASSLLKLQDEAFISTFTICIQLGAILAISLLYAHLIFRHATLYKKLFVAFIPTAIIGLLLYKIMKLYLFQPLVVAIALIVGGIILIFLDNFTSSRKKKHVNLDKLTYRNAFFIGLFQSIAIIPGVSRAAATIIGGVCNGFDKEQATEFSFLLAIPTIFVATGYDLFKFSGSITTPQIWMLIAGGIISFLVAYVTVKLFMKFIKNYGFSAFGYYRIALGMVFLFFFI
jgi:undecaprenyl-diphosphatase